ncbi:MAG: metal ABC transporter permease, partial [Spirochaetota bacterium]|nr:metal ABC transporter permease [Spirochaetota bacterium]
ISEDSAIGILLVTAMALGILFLGFRKSYTYDIFGYLFGNIISVGEDDVWIISITGFMIISIVIIFFKRLFYFIFDPDSASVAGLNIDFYHLLLLTLLSITIVISIKVVGIILVSAYLVISGATAQLLTKSLKKMMLISIIVGFISTFLGLFVSNSYELPSGAVIVLTMLFFFILALIINYLKKRRLQLKEQ